MAKYSNSAVDIVQMSNVKPKLQKKKYVGTNKYVIQNKYIHTMLKFISKQTIQTQRFSFKKWCQHNITTQRIKKNLFKLKLFGVVAARDPVVLVTSHLSH